MSVIAGRRLPPALPASLLRHLRPPPPIPCLLQPFPFPGESHDRYPSARGSCCDSQAERIIRIMASPALSRRGSPGSLCAPDTQTIPGAPQPRLPRRKPRKDTKQKKTNPERGEGRLTEPCGHLGLLSLGLPSTPRSGTLVGHPELQYPSPLSLQVPDKEVRGATVTAPAANPSLEGLSPINIPFPARGDPRSGGDTSEPAGTDSATACSVCQPELLPPSRSARVPAAGAL